MYSLHVPDELYWIHLLEHFSPLYTQQIDVKDMAGRNHDHGNDGRTIKYDPQSDAYYRQYDWADEKSLTVVTVKTVAAVTDRNATDIEMFERINPDALEALFEPATDEVRSDTGGVWFTLAEHTVIVHSNGLIEIHPPPADGEHTDREKVQSGLRGDIRT